jgi:peroxiredoxin Q/BCP
MVNGLVEGAKAPAFKLPNENGEDVSLADFAGQKLVLYFYPKADTPGCTTEAMDFSRLAKAFGKAGTTVLGISADPVGKLVRFRQKHDLTVPLLSDERHTMLEAYGVWGEKSMYGKKFMGVKRTTVLIDPDGRVARLWQNVKVPGHAEEVLAAAKTL